MIKRMITCLCVLIISIAQTYAADIKVAVAVNFHTVMQDIALRFKKVSGHTLSVSSGSSGKLYAQILNGAPYDVFFSADDERPALLESQGIAAPGSRFTYARGKLVLWSASSDIKIDGVETLRLRQWSRLAMANPKLAPYGRAAQQVLQGEDLWKALQSNIVMGENIGQAYQFVHSGSVPLGFVAYSQVHRPGGQPMNGSMWIVDAHRYTPIEQQAVILRNSQPVREFMQYIQSDVVRMLLHEYGYEAP